MCCVTYNGIYYRHRHSANDYDLSHRDATMLTVWFFYDTRWQCCNKHARQVTMTQKPYINFTMPAICHKTTRNIFSMVSQWSYCIVLIPKHKIGGKMIFINCIVKFCGRNYITIDEPTYIVDVYYELYSVSCVVHHSIWICIFSTLSKPHTNDYFLWFRSKAFAIETQTINLIGSPINFVE